MRISPIISAYSSPKNNTQLKGGQPFAHNPLTQNLQRDSVSFSGIVNGAEAVFAKFKSKNIGKALWRNDNIDRLEVITEVQKDLANAIKKNNVKEILEYFGFKSTVNKNNLLDVETYKARVFYDDDLGDFRIQDFGIDENKLFKNIETVKGDLDIDCNSSLTDLGSLEAVGGSAFFESKTLSSFGNLKSIGEDIVISSCPLTTLGNLESVGRHVDIGFTFGSPNKLSDLGKLKSIVGDLKIGIGVNSLKSLGDIESIGGDAYFYNALADMGKLKSTGGSVVITRFTTLTSLGNLKSVGGDLSLQSAFKLADLGELEKIGGSAYFDTYRLSDLGKLKSIGRDLCIETFPKKLTSLGNLKSVGGDARLNNSHLVDLGELKEIGGNFEFRFSSITDLGKLKSIGKNKSECLIFLNKYITEKEIRPLINKKTTYIRPYSKPFYLR